MPKATRLHRFLAGITIGWGIVLGASGCMGRGGPVRIPVRGTVLRNQSPLDKGSINLLPVDGLAGPSAVAKIEKGRYEFDARNGPVAGPHRVVVMSDAAGKAAVMSAMAGGAASPFGQGVQRWEFHTEIPSKGPYQYDLSLE